MSRLQPVQTFLDELFPALSQRAADIYSEASIERIEDACHQEGRLGVSPAGLPICSWLAPAIGAVPKVARLQELCASLEKLAPFLCWRTRSGDHTASADFSLNHANAMILGPGGIEERRDIWIGLSLLAPGTRYPDHRHAPEETYLVLSPGEFRKEGADWFEPGAGGSFYVPPGAEHAMRARDEAPLLAIWALWAGHEKIS